VSGWPEPIARGYETCARLTVAHYENFPVASRLLPSAMRPHVAAVYAFARTIDDIADEGHEPAAVRQARLDEWRQRLHAAAGAASRSATPATPVTHDELIAAAVGHTIRTLDLPLVLFDDLLSAFGQDTTTTRYASWSDLLDYCRRSANPIGRLVLRIAGYRDDALDRSSDALCTALQLTNFWQDFGIDWRRGRLYVPREVLDRHAAAEADLSGAMLPPSWGRALLECAAVTAARFEDGRRVCDALRGRLRYELRLTWLGGHRILDAVAGDPRRVLERRPSLGASDVPILLWRAIRWRGAVA
jgi:squalene synthase HpnC